MKINLKKLVNSQRNPDLSSLSIPQFDVSVEAGREELGAVVVELHFSDRHLVTSIRTHDLVLSVHFPQFDLENFIIYIYISLNVKIKPTLVS